MRALAVALLAAVVAAPLVLAQPPAPKPKAPEYDPTTEVTIKGTVEDIHESKVLTDHPGLHVILKTETETVEVHACPVRFLKDLEFTVEKGDTLTVVGSQKKAGEVVVAREITKGQVTLNLRDKKGIPIWTGR
jgi:hypothetical protein